MGRVVTLRAARCTTRTRREEDPAPDRLVHHWRTHLGEPVARTVRRRLVVGDSVRAANKAQRVGAFERPGVRGPLRDGGAGGQDRRQLGAGRRSAPARGREPGDGPARAGIACSGRRRLLRHELRRRAARCAGAGPLLNRRIADQLGVEVGDEIGCAPKPSLMRKRRPWRRSTRSRTPRVAVDAVLEDDEFGRFGLRASQVLPFNVFVSRRWLAELELPGRANLVLLDTGTARADAALASLCSSQTRSPSCARSQQPANCAAPGSSSMTPSSRR